MCAGVRCHFCLTHNEWELHMYVYTHGYLAVIYVLCAHAVNYVCIAPHGDTLHVDCRVIKNVCWLGFQAQRLVLVLLHYECTVINGCC